MDEHEGCDDSEALDNKDGHGELESVEKPGEVDTFDGEQKPGKSLSRTLLNFSLPRVAGLFLGVPWLIAPVAALVQGLSVKEMFWIGLLSMVPITFFGLFLFGASALVYEFLYMLLPGRHDRDRRWLSSWYHDEDDTVHALACSPAKGLPFQIGLAPPENLNPGVVLNKEFLAQVGPEERPAATLWVGPYLNGHRVQLQIKLPSSLVEQMAPCVGVAEVMQEKWAPDLLPDAKKVSVPVRVFGGPAMRDMLSLEDLQTHSHDELWISLYQAILVPWAKSKVYWRADSYMLVIDRYVRPHRLEPTLQELRDLAAQVWPMLTYARQPLHLQIAAALCDSLYKAPKREHKAFELQPRAMTSEAWRLRWWAVLCEHFGDEEETRAQLSYFFLSATKTEHHTLFQAVSANVRDATLVPWLRAFVVRGRGRDEAVFSGPYSVVGGVSFAPYATPARFVIWFSVLSKYLPEDRFVAFCQRTIARQPRAKSGWGAEMLYASREVAMLVSMSSGSDSEGQIGGWLQTLDLRLKRELLKVLVVQERRIPGLEISLLPSLFAEKSQLEVEEREVCLAALKFAVFVGGEATIATIQQGLKNWDAEHEAAVVTQAIDTLGQLLSTQLHGALSTAEGADEEGHLSIANDEACEGQLSIVNERKDST